MEQIGLVTDILGDNKVQLQVKRTAGCGSCKGCAGSCEVKPHYVVLKNTIDAKPGDYVELMAMQKNIMKYITIIYMVPFIFLIVGIIIGNMIFGGMETSASELSSFGVGMLFLVVSLLVIRIIDKRFAKKDESVIVMTRKL
jgi:sigma-E factor negative regulatory protein RseC